MKIEPTREEILAAVDFLPRNTASRVRRRLEAGDDPASIVGGYNGSQMIKAVAQYRASTDRGSEAQLVYSILKNLGVSERQVDVSTCVALDLMPSADNPDPRVETKRLPAPAKQRLREMIRDGIFSEKDGYVSLTPEAVNIIQSTPQLVEHFESARQIREEIEALPHRGSNITISRIIYPYDDVYGSLVDAMKKSSAGRVSNSFRESIGAASYLVFQNENSAGMMSVPEAYWRELKKALRISMSSEDIEHIIGLRQFQFVKRYQHEFGCQRVWCLDETATEQFHSSMARLGTNLAMVYREALLSNEDILAIIARANDIEATLGNKDPIRHSENMMVETTMRNAFILAPQNRTSIPNPARMYFNLDKLREGTIRAVREEAHRLATLWSEGQLALEI